MGMDNDQEIQQAVKVLRNGGVIIFPTDTVWGIGVKADDGGAATKFYEIKKREEDKPSQILVADLEQAEQLGEFNIKVFDFAERYWPGALTVVVPGKTGGKVGLRVPDHHLTQELCRRTGGIMAGSANFAGKPAPMKREGLDPELVKLVDLVVDGECGQQESSAVIDTTKNPWVVVRRGPVKLDI